MRITPPDEQTYHVPIDDEDEDDSLESDVSGDDSDNSSTNSDFDPVKQQIEPSQPSPRHSIFDRSSVLRYDVDKRDEHGLIQLKNEFITSTVDAAAKELMVVPVTVRIYRLSTIERLYDTWQVVNKQTSASMPHYPSWFQHLFEANEPASVKTRLNFIPVDFSVGICSILHSLSVPIVKNNFDFQGNSKLQWYDAKAVALYVAHAFLQKELLCPSALGGLNKYGYPYLITVQPSSDAVIRRMKPEMYESTSAKYWFGNSSPSGASSSGGRRNNNVAPKRILVWRHQDNQYWSQPMDIDENISVYQITSALVDTWPSRTDWLLSSLHEQGSSGYERWMTRQSSIFWNITNEVDSSSSDFTYNSSASDVLLVPLVNHNNAILAANRHKHKHRPRGESGSSSSSNSTSLADIAVSHHPSPFDALPNGSNGQSQSSFHQSQTKSWKTKIAQFYEKSKAINFSCLNGLFQYPVCLEDVWTVFIPGPPDGSLALNALDGVWTSKLAQVVGVGTFNIIISIPWIVRTIVQPAAEEGRKNHKIPAENSPLISREFRTLKALDMSSLVDQAYVATNGSNVGESLTRQKEVSVDYASSILRREIWTLSIIPPHKYIVKFYGWFLFGPMLCMVMETLSCTLGLLLARIKLSSRLDTKGIIDFTNEKNLERLIRYMPGDEHRNPHIVCETSFKLKVLHQVLTMQAMFKFHEESFSRRLCLLNVFYRLFCGLHHLHSNGVVHRDVKPSNIMFDSKARVKIIDFGYAQPICNSIFVHVVGSKKYQPKDFMGENNANVYLYDDGSIDVYAALQMMKDAFGEILQSDKALRPLNTLINTQMSFMAEHVLRSMSEQSGEFLSRMDVSRPHRPFSASQEYIDSRFRMKDQIVTAYQMAQKIKSCINANK